MIQFDQIDKVFWNDENGQRKRLIEEKRRNNKSKNLRNRGKDLMKWKKEYSIMICKNILKSKHWNDDML